ncbi:restriction endonuclease subunit S [Bacteroides thetaiotaomicron]|uniref:Type I restriction enzyme EcoAI specificity protein n=1 Tax=Bacteroides thetaiotaomicron TaxID=818 RepID=A0A174NEN1_BACT4|nr:restriction endonuclease subunit S [Bacteroides thetaiotaomicron]CUP47053.1 type I restriction enzyme EcoAI specificity protein [Bacteroides thetaiotaomicron]
MSQFIEMFGGLCQDTPWSDVVTITNGKAYPEEYQEEGAYPICGSGGIMCYGEKKLCNGNTTILGRKGNINNPIFMESGYWIVDTAFSIDVDKAKLHPKFFYYWCCQYDFTKLNKQGVLPSLTRKDLEKVKMAIPQMRDQLKFVSIAEQADKSKFGDFKSQFIEMFGNPVTNTKGWKTAKIKDVAPEMPSKEQLSGKIWLLNLDMIESNTGRIIEKVYEDVENALSVQSFDEGNVLFSKLRPYLNKVVIPDEPGMATTELVPLRPEPSKLHKVFLSHLLRGNQFVNYANDIAGGTKMPRMPLTELRNFDCILPPMDKQLEFVFIAEQADKSKSVIQKALVYLNDIQSDELGKIA